MQNFTSFISVWRRRYQASSAAELPPGLAIMNGSSLAANGRLVARR